MQKLVDKIFRKYGVLIKAQDAKGTHEIKAFIKRGASSARKYLLTDYCPVGEISQGHHAILLPRYEAQVGKLLYYNNRWYIIRRFERVWFRDQALYDWCLCEERGQVDTWDM